MKTLTHGALFNGIGGFCLSAAWAGIPTEWTVEIDEFCNKVSKKHFPDAQQYTDIHEARNLPYVDIISGGFPCQDLSTAGKGKGITGERSGLWFEMFRIIDETRPSYVVIENSPELLKKGFEKVLYPLSEIGYDAEWQCLPAAAFGAPHRRNRVFVVAYTKCKRPPSGIFKHINPAAKLSAPRTRSIAGYEYGEAWNGEPDILEWFMGFPMKYTEVMP